MSKQRQAEAAKPQAGEPESVGGPVDLNPTATEAAVLEQPKPQADEGEPRVFSVEIPHCLLGKRTFVAADANDALQKYKTLGGITVSQHIPIIAKLPTDCRDYAVAVEACRSAGEAGK